MDSAQVAQIDQFYAQIRAYWGALSTDGEAPTDLLNFGHWSAGVATLGQAQWALLGLVEEAACLEPAGRVIEVGCGLGTFAADLAGRFGGVVMGVDLLAEHVAQARRRGSKARFEIGCAMSGLPADPETFDRVLCVESAFHYPDKGAFFAEARRVLRPGGRIVLADICCEADAVAFRSGNHFVSTAALHDALADAGFVDVVVQRIGEQVFGPLRAFVGEYNQTHGLRRSRVPRYWERVLSNYLRLSEAQVMDYVVVSAVRA